jgi:hypothetical protein
MRFLILAAALPLMACSFHHHHHDDDGDSSSGIAGTGTGSARTYQVADFSKVEVAGSDDVDVTIGSTFSVRAEGDSDELDHLKIEKDGDTLSIGRHGHHFSWGGSHKGLKVHVTMPRIAGASMAGSGDMTIDRVEGDSFSSDGSGSGALSIAALAVKDAHFSLAGSGSVSAKGTADSVKIDIAGSGDVDAKELTAKSADVSIAGSGDVKAQVNGTASVSIMGSGDVDLGPKAKCSVSKMGSGSVTCGAGGSTS